MRFLRKNKNTSTQNCPDLIATTKTLQGIAENLKVTATELEKYVFELKVKSIAKQQIDHSGEK